VELAPIYIAACRRPGHLAQLVESLTLNPLAKESELHIVVGAPKNPSEFHLAKETLKVASSFLGFRVLEIHERFELKTGSSLIDYCVRDAFKSHEKVIVLEDDLLVRNDFLQYMNSALDKYRHDHNVGQISAWNFGLMQKDCPQQTYFFPNTTSWGWGTWKRAWDDREDLESNYKWVVEKSHRLKKFNHGGTYNDIGMIEAIRTRNYDAWDAAWALDCCRKGRLVLYPNSSLILNNGFDGSGLNFKKSFKWNDAFTEYPQNQFIFSDSKISRKNYRSFIKAHKKWVTKSYNWSKWIIYVDIILRQVRQHKLYYRPGFYSKK